MNNKRFPEKQIARIKRRDEDENEGKYTLNRCWMGDLWVALIKDCSRSIHVVNQAAQVRDNDPKRDGVSET